MPVPPPLELKLAVKRSQYKHARTAKRKAIIEQQVKRIKRETITQ
ncbi:hypothetical protein QF117_09230 [Vibrio sp. YMD68]|nr:hypothetical protein [Vibrio sp. YMD68]WGW00335.1 hypothetical protein QF117_21145 [Vibrio sp. YMD68]WGW00984.1 hypothetical protein QF117_09230 [Vibrio sp. YMD68]